MRLSPDLLQRQPQSAPSSSPSISNATPTSSLGSLISLTGSPSPTSTPSTSHGTKTTAIVAVVAVLLIITAFLAAFFVLRSLRYKHKNPKYIPTTFLKKRWEKWEPKKHYRVPNSSDHLEPISNARNGASNRANGPPSSFDAAARSAVASAAAGTLGVDRNTSVRSVMTLPAYNQHAMQNEQILAREGERGGIDVVIEFPEGADEEESRREEEMEALYQVRLARRRENEDREERRRLRREARERGDYVALRELQARARASSTASGNRTVEELRAEHDRIKKERQRAISSVSYADLGVARHDGTRLRANSTESERDGLLGDAASIAASSHYHHSRDRSASSILSIDTMNSDFPSPALTRSRGNSRGESTLRQFTNIPDGDGSPSNDRAGSSPEIISHEDVPTQDPPEYEDISLDTPQDRHGVLEPPPDYSSPLVGQGAKSEPPPLVPPQDTESSTQSAAERRISASHVAAVIADRRTSSSTPDSRRSSRGVGGVPQLPSLRLGHLPSIHINSPSPTVRRVDEELEHGSDTHPEHHPEE